jgi:hypothetical protein
VATSFAGRSVLQQVGALTAFVDSCSAIRNFARAETIRGETLGPGHEAAVVALGETADLHDVIAPGRIQHFVTKLTQHSQERLEE